MADGAALLKLQSGISKKLEGLVSKSALMSGFLKRYALPEYVNTQRVRFESRNSGSDFIGGGWADLDPQYEINKKVKYSAYPGQGTKINIATSRLFSSLSLVDSEYSPPPPKTSKGKGLKSTGTGAEYRVAVDDRSLHIFTSVPYAQFVDDARTFSGFSPIFYARIKKKALLYVLGADK